MTTADWVQLVTDALDKVVIPLVGLALGWAAVHWGWKQQAERTLARQDLVGAAARTAVGAVEQQMAGAQGAEKRRQAIDAATTILAAHGVTLTAEQQRALGTAIEAQVLALKRVTASTNLVVHAVPGGGAMTPFAANTSRATTNTPVAPPPLTPATRTAAAPQKGGV